MQAPKNSDPLLQFPIGIYIKKAKILKEIKRAMSEFELCQYF